MQLSQHPPIHSTCEHGNIWQSPCWYYPRSDAAVTTSADTQHLWAWWHLAITLLIFWYYPRSDAAVSTSADTQHLWAWWHLAITLLILSPVGCSCLNNCRYIAPVGMMTFRWSLRFYQCICQQHPLYLHLQVTLIYYTGSNGNNRVTPHSASAPKLEPHHRMQVSVISRTPFCRGGSFPSARGVWSVLF